MGPILFSLYTAPLSQVIAKYPSLKFHLYADDTQLYFHLVPNSDIACFNDLQSCLNDIKQWMSSCKLKLNPDKTEFIVFGSDVHRTSLSGCFPIDILGCPLIPADIVKNLGVLFDSSFSFSNHVSSICRRCYVGIRDLGRIRRSISKEAAILAANALVSSHLDYCNSLFRSLSAANTKRLQSLQNWMARIVCNKPRQSHISPVLKDLHWLPVKYRSIFKTMTIVFKYLDSGLPHYFHSTIQPYSTSFSSRRSNPSKRYLSVPTFCNRIHKSKKHFDHSFSYDAPYFWNSLPENIRLAPSVSSFRKRLKPYFFHMTFPP